MFEFTFHVNVLSVTCFTLFLVFMLTVFFVEPCQFYVGWSYEASEELIDNTPTSRECVIIVKGHKPRAIGVIWQSRNTKIGGQGNCFAIFDNPTSTDDNPTYHTCLFDGTPT